MTQKANNGTELLVGKFSQMESVSSQPKWLLPVRKAGIASFADQGFPTLHDEDWRFTNVAPIAMLPFQPAGEISVNGAETKAIKESSFAELPSNRVVFVNGLFSEKLSSLKTIAGGVKIEN